MLLSLFIGLILLSFQVLKFFIVPVVWAAILAYITWPIYQAILRSFGHRHNLSALVMTILLSIVIGVPFIMAIFLLQHEGRDLYINLQHQIFSGGIVLPDVIKSVPIIGPELNKFVAQLNAHPYDLASTIRHWVQGHIGYGKIVLGEISRNIFKLTLAILTLFFFYRDGNFILDQVRTALDKVIGYRVHSYLLAIGETTRAVVYGVGLTALAQALLAGIGYWVAGAPNPMMLTFATFLLALIPFGTPFAWGGVSIWLLSQGQTWEAAGLALWGLCVVSWIDNIIRPLVISGATKIPFLLIMFGVLGGLASFGMVGIFIGPVILAILLAVWREWLHQKLTEPEQEQLFEEPPIV
ncbi:AI-2E family transporter [Alkanindiges sp. WGS2144]|uniref:AI-2E family transporter n=1 Tax=Alkanindiges sp. WGS2144 TaxID=3366808 RepID=UPI003753697A